MDTHFNSHFRSVETTDQENDLLKLTYLKGFSLQHKAENNIPLVDAILQMPWLHRHQHLTRYQLISAIIRQQRQNMHLQYHQVK